jgi:uncharacterized Ntn-hydrolase superfamily protein
MPILSPWELAKWIEENVDVKVYDHPDPYEAARWFVAYQIAKEMHDVNRLKDTAHLVMDGMMPLSHSDMQQWFDEGNTGDEAELMVKLRRHFGLV